MKKIGVIGIGNPLRRDDGIGIILLEKLRENKEAFPDTIEFVDGGTGGMNLLHDLSRFDKILFIDAVRFGGKAGESKLFSYHEVISTKQPMTLSTHGDDLLAIIKLSEELGEKPHSISFFGIQPNDTSVGTTLSPELAQNIDVLVTTLTQTIKRL